MQPVPYKVYAYEAGRRRVNLAEFTAASAVARTARIIAFGLATVGMSRPLRRRWPHYYPAYLAASTAIFSAVLTSAFRSQK